MNLTDAALTGVGEELRRAREAQGLAVSDVAHQLKFVPRQIEALEQERFKSLPGPTIARGMVRNYARLLQLDPEPLLERIAERLDAPDAGQLAARYSQPVPFSDGTRRSTFVYLGLSLGILGLVGALAYEWHRERASGLAFAPPAAAPIEAPPEPPPAPFVKEPPPAPLAEEPPPPAAPVAKAQKKNAEARVTAQAPPTGQAPETPPKPVVEKVVPVEQAAPAVQQAAPAVDPASLRRLVLRCEEESWIEVRDGLDRQLVHSLNPAGTERVVQGVPPFSLVIGNAQHVRLTYGDREIDLRPHTRVEVARFTLE